MYRRGSDRMSIITKAFRTNPAHGEVYSIHTYVIMVVSYLRKFGGFYEYSSTYKVCHHNLTEILLNLALSA